MGRTPAPSTVRSADDVLDLLIGFAEEVGGGEPVLLIGHSAGGYFAHGLAARRPDLVAGMALVCPLLADLGNVPDQLPVTVADNLGDEEFRKYFVVQTPEMLQRYERFVAPALPLVDQAAAERIGDRWELTLGEDSAYDGPTFDRRRTTGLDSRLRGGRRSVPEPSASDAGRPRRRGTCLAARTAVGARCVG
jgi:pimeloyl-ACP methyl ester carboxylesterase